VVNNLSLQRGKGLSLNSSCLIKHPTLGEIENLGFEDYKNGLSKEYGYEKYSQLLYSIILTSKDLADVLWFENQIWYEDIEKEWDFFLQRALSQSKIIEVEMNIDDITGTQKAIAIDGNIKQALNFFLQLDGEFILVEKRIGDSDEYQVILFNTQTKINEETNEPYYFVNEDNFKFTEMYYNITVEFLKKINWINIEYDFVKGGSKNAKIYILKNLYKKRGKNKKQYVDISTINSSIMAKNNRDTWDMPIYSFYDCYYRLVKIDEYNNTMSALYAGGIDTKKNPINWEKINWSSIINI
jgi:hypothetical protein